jgi:hypothetical protein
MISKQTISVLRNVTGKVQLTPISQNAIRTPMAQGGFGFSYQIGQDSSAKYKHSLAQFPLVKLAPASRRLPPVRGAEADPFVLDLIEMDGRIIFRNAQV